MQDLSEIVICHPLRTAVGGFGGMYRRMQAHDLASAVVSALIDQCNLPKDIVEDVIFAQCFPTMDAPALGRVVALDAGLPIETPGIQVDRRCGSGLQAVIYGVMTVATGGADLVVVGGAESMSNASFFANEFRWGQQGTFDFKDSLQQGRKTAGGKHYPVEGGMIETAENLRAEFSISREAQDEFAYHSHQKAIAAQNGSVFRKEIVPIETSDRKGNALTLSVDEHPRPDISRDKLAKLTPIMSATLGNATVTAGNSSGQNDGAAAAIVCTRALANDLGLDAFASLKSWAVAGVAPKRMGIGPVASTKKALDRAGLEIGDMGIIELNEAFAAQALAVLKAWNVSPEDARLNPNGSGISLGHPVGATGVRIMATLLHEMRRGGQRYGLETMCIGGGQGLTAIFETVS